MEIERGIDPSDRSDTPETDAAVFDIPNYGADGTGSRVAVVHYQVAVRLERERDAARARVAELEAQHEKYQAIVFKARDILKCGHIDNMASSLHTLCNRYNDAQAQIATLEAECERLKHERNRAGMDARKEMMDELAKLKDPVAVHINMLRGTIATPSVELMEHVWGQSVQTQQPLERPDRPGWWWVWVDYDQYGWAGVYVDEHDLETAVEGQWLPATLPPVPSEKEAQQ
mgnify:FL=1